jgi:hypothetical protein
MDRGIYTDDMAALCKEDAGKPYRPSNGTEGMIFDDAYCSNCKRDAAWREDENSADPCPLLSNSFAYNIGDPDYPTEWQYGPDGQPTCTAFEDKDAPDPPDPNQMNLFSAPTKGGVMPMIEPTEADIGRQVTYTGNRYPGGELEYGEITSFNSRAVFVRYWGDLRSKATSYEDLEWSHP